ncbi:MAG: molecular chaperone HtpG [Planctomycetes bacterium]|nr:molecular chaperone HtpG [Planctomycetota bacterium]
MSEYKFETEVQQMLQIMIHSLYSESEIFLRELVSNASDACDKFRFASLTDDSLAKGDGELKVEVDFNSEDHTITISDNGIGLTLDEAKANLGTIAKSGTKEFLDSVDDEKKSDLSTLIGQFGVGFYSSFIVAERVVVESRSAAVSSDEAVRWESTGDGSFDMENISRPQRGTTITLFLRENSHEYADSYRLRSLITKYSDYVTYPIFMEEMPEPKAPDAEDKEDTDEKQEEKELGREQINQGTPLWTRSKSDVEEEDYKSFYKSACKQWDEPASWIHFNVEGSMTFTALLYFPGSKPFDLFDRSSKGLSLYVRRVFIMDDCDDLLPEYLRFVKGVVDSDDLPLNVSREILQQKGTLDKLRKQLVKRILNQLEKLSKSSKEDEQKAFLSIDENFGPIIREGIVQDADNKEKIAGFARYLSSWTQAQEDVDKKTGFNDYIDRMPEGQENIYILPATSLSAAQGSPHLEGYLKKGYEVLFLVEPVDEWVSQHLNTYKEKTVVNIVNGADDLSDEGDKEELEKISEDYKAFMEFCGEKLGDDIKEVRLSRRLTDSPCCIVNDDGGVSSQMEELMKRHGQAMPAQQRILELNPDHELVQKLNELHSNDGDQAQLDNYVHLLRDQALLSDGSPVADSIAFAKRIQGLMASAF